MTPRRAPAAAGRATGRPMTSTLLLAFALMLVIAGILPFLAPRLWRDTFRRLTEMSEGQIRFVGLTAMLAGLLLLAVVH